MLEVEWSILAPAGQAAVAGDAARRGGQPDERPPVYLDGYANVIRAMTRSPPE